MNSDTLELEQRLEDTAQAITETDDYPSEERIDAFFDVVRELPVPDFSHWAVQEKAGNTERYKQIRTRIRRFVGLSTDRSESGHVDDSSEHTFEILHHLHEFISDVLDRSFSDGSLHVLQQWQGFVIEVLSTTFRARLLPVQGEGEDQEAEIYIEAVSPNLRQSIQPGALFVWTIGYRDHGTERQQVSSITFDHLKEWKQSDLMRAEADTRHLESLFGNE